MLDSSSGRRMKLMLTAVIVCSCALALGGGPIWAQCEEQEIIREHPDYYDYFGASVAVEGDTLVVGAPGVDDLEGNVGAAFVYRHIDGKWTLQQTLQPELIEGHADFGSAVAMDGDLMIVGARGYNEPGSNAGAGFVFRYDGLHWVQEQQLRASDAEEFDGFGFAVAISGDIIAVGAPFADPFDRGAVYLYRYNGSAWAERLKQQGAWADGRLGFSLTASGDIVIAGNPFQFPGGVVWCFRDLGESWAITQFAPGGVDVDDAFGISVAMSGDLLVTGATYDGDNGLDAGAAYVFRRDGDDWIETQKLLASTGRPDEYFGTSVATDGNRIVVGAIQDEEPGRAYVYAFDGQKWQEEAELHSAFCSPDAKFGSAAGLHGETPIVAADWDDLNGNRCGSVHVFSLVGGDCNANGYCDWLDLLEGVSEDCNLNEVPDECDIALPLDLSSGIMLFIGYGYPQQFTIDDPLNTIEDVELDFHAAADLDAEDEWIDVDINGSNVGRVFQFDGTLCGNDHAILTVPAETFNDLIAEPGEAIITMTTPSTVNALACDGFSLLTLHVIYDGRINDDNENGIPDECDCPADFDGDWTVDTADLLFLLGAWGTPDGDVDFDGDTDTADLLALLAAWGECPE